MDRFRQEQRIISRGAAAGILGARNWFADVQPLQMVAVSRLVLAALALLAIFADPGQPARSSELAYILLGAYVLYAGALVLETKRISSGRIPAVLVAAVDITVFSLLIYLTDGPTSPFFVFFTFALFSATLRWSWRGVLPTAILIVLIYAGLALTAEIDQGEDVTRTILRSAYLIVVGILFVYFGVIQEREHLRFAQMASWPAGMATSGPFPGLDPILAHLAETAKAPHLLVVWEDDFEPHRFFAEFLNGKTRYWIEMAQAPERPASATSRIEPASPPIRGSSGTIEFPDRILREHDLPHSVKAPLGGTEHNGWIFLVGEQDVGGRHVPLAAIAALRIGTEIELHRLRQGLMQAAVRDGRNRLARDIHDSLLQSLAAIGLQLKALEPRVPASGRQNVSDIRMSIAHEQDRLRQLISEARGDQNGRAARIPLETALVGVLDEMAGQWQCKTSHSVDLAGLFVSEDVAKGLSMFIAEAVANSVRHGKASTFRVAVMATENALSVEMRDNGSGLSGLSGALAHERVFTEGLGSASLRRRAADLGATMTFVNSPGGLQIDLALPIK